MYVHTHMQMVVLGSILFVHYTATIADQIGKGVRLLPGSGVVYVTLTDKVSITMDSCNAMRRPIGFLYAFLRGTIRYVGW